MERPNIEVTVREDGIIIDRVYANDFITMNLYDADLPILLAAIQERMAEIEIEQHHTEPAPRAELLTTPEAAATLGITTRRVRQLIDAGQLHAELHGRDYLISRAALDTYSRTRRPTGRPRKQAQAPAQQPNSAQAPAQQPNSAQAPAQQPNSAQAPALISVAYPDSWRWHYTSDHEHTLCGETIPAGSHITGGTVECARCKREAKKHKTPAEQHHAELAPKPEPTKQPNDAHKIQLQLTHAGSYWFYANVTSGIARRPELFKSRRAALNWLKTDLAQCLTAYEFLDETGNVIQ